MAEHTNTADGHGAGTGGEDASRRDFLFMTTGALAAVGVVGAVWPFVHSMNPARDTLALATTTVDLEPIAVGQAVTVTWRGKPVFIRHRTEAEIAEARAVTVDQLPDPATDEERVKQPQWLIVLGVCTHLGCVPLGTKQGEPRGEYGGWFCPCHGSHYDTAGRIRKGPAPLNLPVPQHLFENDGKTVKIG